MKRNFQHFFYFLCALCIALANAMPVSADDVTESPYTTAKIDFFSDAKQGDIDAHVVYETGYVAGTSYPNVNTKKCLVLYQATKGYAIGNYVTISGKRGVTIESVTLGLGTTYSIPRIGYTTGEVTETNRPTRSQMVKTGGTYTKSGLNCSEVTFFSMGNEQNNRLEIASITVEYILSSDATLSSLTVDVPQAVLRQRANSTFSHKGVKVKAHYSDDSYTDVTESATFSTPDMTTAGEKTVTVSYTDEGITQETTFTMEVYAADYIFYESFDKNTSTGGNDGKWTTDGGATIVYDNDDWSKTGSVYGANTCARVGAASTKGALTTPPLDYNGMAKLTFKAAPGTGEATNIVVSLNKGKIVSPMDANATKEIKLTMVNGQWTEYTLYLSEVEETTCITISAATRSKNRFFLDEVKVVAESHTKVTTAECGYTTVCLPYNAVVVNDASLYALEKADGKGLHFVKTDMLTAHHGYLLKGTAGQTYLLTEVRETVAPTTNLLMGVVDHTAVTELNLQGTGNFAYPWILAKDGCFKRYTGDYIPAGKAYLDGALLQAFCEPTNGANTLRVIFDTEELDQETGLTQLDDKQETSAIYYNLHGQRLSQPHSGALYIERGSRKVIVK